MSTKQTQPVTYFPMKDQINRLIAFFSKKINKGQERSIKAKKNIIGSFFIRGTSIVISIVMVPLAINYVNVSQYGIWLTISSIVVWFSFFDIGLTQGLRNKFAEAVAKGNHELAQIYVSTTYAILGIICSAIWLVFLFVNQYLNWPKILNSPSSMHRELSILALMVFTYFCLNFVLKIINILLIADQQPALSSLLALFGQIFSLLCIFILVHTTKGSLIYLGAVFCFSPVVILLIAHVFFFKGNFKKYRPSISKVQFPYARSLFNLGVVFFVIQVAGIVQYQTANIIIAQQFSTADVTQYNIAYKYFGITKMGYAIFLLPFWSACTEAFLKNDIAWIKKSIAKYKQLIALLFLAGCIMLIFSNKVYDVWLGKGKVNINFYLSLWGFIYFFTTMIADTYVSFLNGINALRIQFIACLLSPFVFIGVAFLLLKYFKMGVYSLFIASIVCNFNGLILAPLQYHMIINKKKKGIWIR